MRRLDVVIAGAGPAGVALALRLRRLGHEVALLSAPAPAAHGFETLNPAARAQLEFEGMTPEFGVFCGCETRWDEVRFTARPTIYQLVDRRMFHRELAARARDAGVVVVEARAQATTWLNDGWRVDSGAGAFRARFLADATGRGGLTGRARRLGAPLIGLHSVWSCDRLPAAVRVAAAPDSWVWGAPTPDGRYAVGVFEDPRRGRRNGDIAARTIRAVAQSTILDGAGGVRLTGAVRARDASVSRRAAIRVPLRLLRLGDAALTLDPLSSAGVQAALQSAVDAAMAINTLARDPGAADLIAEFLERRLSRRAAHHAAYAASFYAAAAARLRSSFWTSRREVATPPPPPSYVAPAPGESVVLNPRARFAEELCLVENSVVRRRAVTAPGRDDAFAFVSGLEIAPLIDALPPRATPETILSAWSVRIGPVRAQQIFEWAWRIGVLTHAAQA